MGTFCQLTSLILLALTFVDANVCVMLEPRQGIPVEKTRHEFCKPTSEVLNGFVVIQVCLQIFSVHARLACTYV